MKEGEVSTHSAIKSAFLCRLVDLQIEVEGSYAGRLDMRLSNLAGVQHHLRNCLLWLSAEF